MSGDDRFVELWNDYLEGELGESGIAELRALVAADDRLLKLAADSYQTHRLLGLLADESQARQDAFVRETFSRLPSNDERFVGDLMQRLTNDIPPEEFAADGDADRRLSLRDRTRPFAERKSTFRTALRAWPSAMAIVMLVLLTASAFAFFSTGKPRVARVLKVTGSSQFFGSNGKTENGLSTGTFLVAGDTLETRSCDAWVTLDLLEDTTLTIAGHSTLRILHAEADEKRFELMQGSLWISPGEQRVAQRLLIQTPTATFEAHDAVLNLQTSSSETTVRVHAGSARVTQRLDGRVAEVSAGHQVTASLGGKASFDVIPQPQPIDSWSCHLTKGPEVILGQWLPPTENERARLGAAPLLWPIPDRDPVMLYAVAIAAWKSSDRPVLLRADSRLRFRGRTERPQTVRFGFSAQKMYGVFAGKFETDVAPESLGPAGETWEVELPLANFRPLHPHLASSADGLELTDVYALTIEVDAGLEITHIELITNH